MDTLPPADLTCRCGQELHIPVTATFDPIPAQLAALTDRVSALETAQAPAPAPTG
jgi:hypothetical protein